MQQKKTIFGTIISYFLKGLLYTVPLTVTVYIIYELFIFLDGLIPSDTPGLGVLVLLGVITLVGILGSTFLANPIERYFTQLLERVPLVKTLYSSIRDLMSAFVGEKRRFNRPVLVKLIEGSEIKKLGFITQEDLSEFDINEDHIAVYLPHSYNFSGNLYIVEKRNVTILDTNAAEVMKFIVSGGVTEVDKKEIKS